MQNGNTSTKQTIEPLENQSIKLTILNFLLDASTWVINQTLLNITSKQRLVDTL